MRVYRDYRYNYFDIATCYVAKDKKDERDTDITTPFALYEFFRVRQIDYIQFRDSCKALLPSWNMLLEDERKFLITHSVRPSDVVVPFNDYVRVVQLEQKAREERWNNALQVGGYYYFNNDLYKLLLYNNCKGMRNDYVEANLPFIVLWLTNGVEPSLGIDFSTTGFANTTYYTAELKELLVNCFIK